MATSVALPLEREFSTIAGLDTMYSINGQDTTQITLQFVLGRNIDAAAQDVQAALTRAQRRLPIDMTDSAVSYRKVNPADAPVVLLALRASDLPLYRLNDVASTIIAPGAVARARRGAGADLRRAALFRAGAAGPRPHRRHGPRLRHGAARRSRRPIPTPRSGCSRAQRQQLTLRANDQPQDAAAFGNLVVGGRAQSPDPPERGGRGGGRRAERAHRLLAQRPARAGAGGAAPARRQHGRCGGRGADQPARAPGRAAARRRHRRHARPLASRSAPRCTMCRRAWSSRSGWWCWSASCSSAAFPPP